MAGLSQGVRRSCSSKRFNGPLSGGFDLLLIDGTTSTTRATVSARKFQERNVA
jgi:hypothetical protein